VLRETRRLVHQQPAGIPHTHEIHLRYIRKFPAEAVAGHLLFVGIQLSFGLGTMSQLQASRKRRSLVTCRARPHAAIHDIAGRISSLHVGGMDLSRDNRRGCSQAITLAVA
jgi:hypothetical protein